MSDLLRVATTCCKRADGAICRPSADACGPVAAGGAAGVSGLPLGRARLLLRRLSGRTTNIYKFKLPRRPGSAGAARRGPERDRRLHNGALGAARHLLLPSVGLAASDKPASQLNGSRQRARGWLARSWGQNIWRLRWGGRACAPLGSARVGPSRAEAGRDASRLEAAQEEENKRDEARESEEAE